MLVSVTQKSFVGSYAQHEALTQGGYLLMEIRLRLLEALQISTCLIKESQQCVSFLRCGGLYCPAILIAANMRHFKS